MYPYFYPNFGYQPPYWFYYYYYYTPEHRLDVETEDEDFRADLEDPTPGDLAPGAGYRWFRSDMEEPRNDGGQMPSIPPVEVQMPMPPMEGKMPYMPDMMEEHGAKTPDEILMMIEKHHPDIVCTLMKGKLTLDEARRVIKKIIEHSIMHCK